MGKEKSEYKQQYQKRKGYFKEYYQKHKDVMDANNKKNAKKYREEYKQLKEENRKLREELEEIKNDLEHRDSFFSIMRDVLANETITNNEIAMILYCVVHEECGDYDLSKKELKIAKEFWRRKYV